MSKLEEIEAAVENLPSEQKQELMFFIVKRLRAQGIKMPDPKQFSSEQVAAWIAEDEADMDRFQKGK